MHHEGFDIPELNDKELRPEGLETIVATRDIENYSVLRAVRQVWQISEVSTTMTMPSQVLKALLAQGHDENEAQDISNHFTRLVMGAKYKPMARKVLPVAMHNPEALVPIYQPIEIGKLDPLPINPTNFESLDYLGRLLKEHIAQIVACVPQGFLTKCKVDLLVHVLKQQEEVIAFTDSE